MSSRNLVLFGTESPAPSSRTLRAGSLSAVLEDGQLRRICWDGREAIRGISFLIRNKDWGTYPARIENLQIEESAAGFSVKYTAHCQDDTQALQYTVQITGDVTKGLEFFARMRPTTDFSTCRAGFIVLHPLDGVAGEPVTVLHTDGHTTQSSFPKHIAAEQPIFDIRALTHQVCPGVSVTCTMQGDAFELEDQRNWSDASFKTYIRPLAKPYPYVLKAGEEQTQSVSLAFTQTTAAPTIDMVIGSERSVTVGSAAGRVPALALTVDAANASEATLEGVRDSLKRLAPKWIVGRVTEGSRREDLNAYARAQEIADAQLWLELVLPCKRSIAAELSDLAQAVSAAGLRPSAISVSPEVLLKDVPAHFQVPGLEAGGMTALFHAARRAFPGVLVGGGSMAYFTELNRNPPPHPALDFITHTTCPIIHAADDDSVMETLQCLPWIFESTLHLAGAAAYWLGPTTIGMRHNPYGSTPAANPDGVRLAMAQVDPRQRGLFAAAFYLAYAAQATRSGLAVLSLCDPLGPFGVMATQTEGSLLFPVYHALRWLSQAAQLPCLSSNVSGNANVYALAYQRGQERTVLLSNTTSIEQPVRLADADQVSVLVLDETSCAEASRSATWSEIPGVPSKPSFVLPPYAVARVILL